MVWLSHFYDIIASSTVIPTTDHKNGAVVLASKGLKKKLEVITVQGEFEKRYEGDLTDAVITAITAEGLPGREDMYADVLFNL